MHGMCKVWLVGWKNTCKGTFPWRWVAGDRLLLFSLCSFSTLAACCALLYCFSTREHHLNLFCEWSSFPLLHSFPRSLIDDVGVFDVIDALILKVRALWHLAHRSKDLYICWMYSFAVLASNELQLGQTDCFVPFTYELELHLGEEGNWPLSVRELMMSVKLKLGWKWLFCTCRYEVYQALYSWGIVYSILMGEWCSGSHLTARFGQKISLLYVWPNETHLLKYRGEWSSFMWHTV